MRRRPTRTLIAWSTIGLIVGHQAAYLAYYRDPAIVSEVLRASDHGWLWLAPIILFAAALTALVVGFAGSDPVRSYPHRFASLALIQVGAFAAVEVAERLAGSADLFDLVSRVDVGILVLGSLIQVAVALVLAAASRIVERVAATLGRARIAAPRRRPTRFLRPSRSVPPALPTPARPFAPRAPPIRA
jgi:hypothetical protein